MSGCIDLHVHTTASDGTFSPSGAVWLARESGLKAIAITDHDTADGVREALDEGKLCGVEVIPGIELSVDFRGHGVHILGYFIDPEAEPLIKLLDWVIEERERRNEKMAAAMRADGIDITLEYMHKRFPDSIIGRPHFAAVLAEKGFADSVADGFLKHLNRGCVYYRKREYIPMDMAFDTLHRCGAKAVFAHPLQYRLSHEELIELTELLIGKGVVGMECIYSLYSEGEREYLMDIARRYGLCVTGGSDFHGAGKPHIRMGSGCGDMEVPYRVLENLKNV